MKAVIQQEKSGCGLASVAVIANTTYEDVKQIANWLDIYAEDEGLWSDTQYVRTFQGEREDGAGIGASRYP